MVFLLLVPYFFAEEWYLASGISHVAFPSVYSEKTRLKKLIMIIIIMNLSQETTVFGGCQKFTSAMQQRPEK